MRVPIAGTALGGDQAAAVMLAIDVAALAARNGIERWEIAGQWREWQPPAWRRLSGDQCA